MLVGERALDGVAGDDGIVDEQAERDDQRGDRDLLEIDAEDVREAEGQGERDRNRDRHQHCGAPFPESDERDDDDESDRFVKRVHEEIDVFFDLARLIGSVGDDEVGGKKLARFFQLFFDVLGEFGDLLGIAHLHGEADGARALPIPFRIAPGVVIQIARGTLIAAANVYEVAEIDGRAEAGAADDHVADVAGFCEFAGGIDDDIFRAGFERAAGQRDVAGVQNSFQIRGLHSVGGQSFLRIIEVDLLGQHAGAIDARDFGRAEQRAGEQIP